MSSRKETAHITWIPVANISISLNKNRNRCSLKKNRMLPEQKLKSLQAYY
uniref:Uncharacterized protein n=1 Tax=Arundo donax TaxID=35708 RepID=A0A0A8ZZU4_ARUDO